MAATEQQGAVPAALLICIGLVLALAYALQRFGPDMADLLLAASRLLLTPVARASERHAHALEALQAMPEGTRSLSFAWQVLTAASKPWAFGLGLPLLCLLAWRGRRLSVAETFRRTLDMQALAAVTRAWAPCTAPALNWPGGILHEPLDSGPWRAGRQPLQLACEHGLLLMPGQPPRPVPPREVLGPDHMPRPDAVWAGLDRAGLALDRERTHALYAGQLSVRWQGWETLPPYLQKLSAAWALFAVGEREAAQALLNACSLSFRGPRPGRGPSLSLRPPFVHRGRGGHGWLMDTSLEPAARKLAREALTDAAVARAMRVHSVWRDLCLLALYEQARTRGVLPTAEFIWLRPVNRQLFYLCNNLGRRTAWPEIAGAWAHYQAESLLARLDPAAGGIAEPHVDTAVDALESALYEEGWISPDRLSERLANEAGCAAAEAAGGAA